jgi:MFS transporter, ACS family, tartrate transporter
MLPTATTPLDSAQKRALRAVTLRKVSRRLLPFLFVLYVCAFLDRINVGFAALHMNSDLGFSATAYGLGSGIFFVGYCLFEVPSNILLYKLGARRWIARIMVTWGELAQRIRHRCHRRHRPLQVKISSIKDRLICWARS